MIPQWEVSIDVSATEPNVTGGLSADLRLSAWVINQDHFPLRPGDWEVAATTVNTEAAIVAAADAGSSTAESFEEALQRAEADGVEEEWHGLDLGVAGLVMALNAAGFATASSCRRHPGNPWAECPFVIATGDADRIRALVPLAVEAGTGASQGPSGEGFGLYAGSVLPLMTLAAVILREHDVFATMRPTIGWDQDAYEADAGW